MIKNEKNSVILRQCDWKDNLETDEIQMMIDHAKKIDGEFIELNVYNADAKIFYSGPVGIENWLGNDCAFEKFVDNTIITDEDGERIGEVDEIYYYPEENEVWVSLDMYNEAEAKWIKF